MKKLMVVLFGLCILVVTFLAIDYRLSTIDCVYAANWTTFRADYERTGFVQEQASGPLTFKWKYNTGQQIISSPVVVNGIIYVGSRSGVLYALDADTGGLVWQYASQSGGWMDATPTYFDGVIYMSCRDGNIYAFDAPTGNFKWKKTIGGTLCSSPVVSSSGVLYSGLGHPNKEVSAFNTWGTKSQKWAYSTGQMVYSSPALNGSNIYIGSDDGKFYSLNVDSGTPKWQFPTSGGIYLFSPTVKDGKVYVAPGDGDRKVYCLNEDNGSPDWSYSLPGAGGYTTVSSVAVAGTACYIVAGNPGPQLCAVNIANSGAEIWKKSLGGGANMGFYSSPAVANKTLYVGSSDGSLYSFDVATGNSTSYSIGAPISSSPSVSNGMIYFGSQGGYIYCYEARDACAIATPGIDGYVGGSAVSIEGNARASALQYYILEYGKGETPTSWVTISNSINSQPYGVLGVWDISDTVNLVHDYYSLRLHSYNGSETNTAITKVVLDRAFLRENIISATGKTLSAADGTGLEIKAGSLTQDDVLTVRTPWTVYSNTLKEANPTNIAREVKLSDQSTVLQSSAAIKIPYREDEIAGMQEKNLRIYYWDEKKGWIVLSTSQPHPEENYVSAEADHFSLFRIMEFLSGVRPVIEPTTTYCYPNPARDVNKMTFKSYLGEDAKIVVNVYNVAAELVATLEKDDLGGKNTTLDWDITNVASGVYIFRVEGIPKSGGHSEIVIKKLAIIH